jgi:signal transduction histidine kinase
MKVNAINSRMLAVAILPVTLVATLLVGIFWLGRITDLGGTYQQRNQYLVRQVALASEYGVFSGNAASLQGVATAMHSEPDVVLVAIFDATGKLMASAGTSFSRLSFQDLRSDGHVLEQSRKGIDSLTETVTVPKVSMDDYFDSQENNGASQILGFVVLEVSREAQSRREREVTYLALAVWLLGVLIGSTMAVRLGRSVSRPIFRVSSMIRRIGRGDFSPESNIERDDPLQDLQLELNRMAGRLAGGRVELQLQVEKVTAELLKRKEEAESATQAKSSFLAAASHDLRQPTHALGLFVTRLGQLHLEPQARSVVNSLEASVQAMQELLDGLLDLSRLDAGNIQADIGPVSVAELFQETLDVLEPIANERGLTLRVRWTDMWGISDRFLLKRMLLNLGHNALRYTENGSVFIACRSCDQGRSVRIEVWDSGIGIAAQHQADIFKEFYQVGNSARDRRRGLGLGLSIVKRSADLLGHGVTLRSAQGCGTRISITMPRTQKPDIDDTSVVATPQFVPSELTSVRILLIEDDDLAQEAITRLLESWGCEVSVAADGAQAKALLRPEALPDMILSDYRLEGEDNGLDIIQMLRFCAGVDLPAVLMSGDTDAELMQKAHGAGIPLLHKPVRPAKLRSLLRNFQGAGAV